MTEFFQSLTSAGVAWGDIGWATVDTLLMLGGALSLTLLLGLPLGIICSSPARASCFLRLAAMRRFLSRSIFCGRCPS